MKIRKKNHIFIIITIVLSMSVFQQLSYAEDDNPIGFSVETIMPDNQIDQNKNYFYIQTKPNEAQKIKVKVTGTSKEPVKIKAFVANAITGENGTVDYKPNIDKDETLINSIEEIATINEAEFELGLGEEKVVEIDVTPPAETYNGIKMGTIYFERVLENVEQGKINNKYSYRIGLMCSESDELYTDSQEFNLLDVTPEIKRAQKSITLTFQNPEPKTIADLSMDIKILDEQTGKIVKTQKLSNGMVAPNSRFNYSVNWGIEAIRSGKYIVKTSAVSRHKSWELEKKFEVTNDQAKQMNEETLYKLTLPTWSYIATVAIGVLTILTTMVLSIRRSKWKKRVRKGNKKEKQRRDNMNLFGGEKVCIKKLLIGILSFVCLSIVFVSGVDTEATSNKDDTELGIEFSRTKDSSTTPSSDYDIPKPEPSSKKGGKLPQTGELMQPIIFMFIGCLFLVLVVALYFSKKSSNKESNG